MNILDEFLHIFDSISSSATWYHIDGLVQDFLNSSALAMQSTVLHWAIDMLYDVCSG